MEKMSEGSLYGLKVWAGSRFPRVKQSSIQMRAIALSDFLGVASGSENVSNLHNQSVKYLPLHLGAVNLAQMSHEPT